jgi:hypothetical protein
LEELVGGQGRQAGGLVSLACSFKWRIVAAVVLWKSQRRRWTGKMAGVLKVIKGLSKDPKKKDPFFLAPQALMLTPYWTAATFPFKHMFNNVNKLLNTQKTTKCHNNG